MNNYILEKATYYYYKLLNEREKELYKTFLNALLNMKTKVEITGSYSSGQVQKVSGYVIKDRPDIFWYRGESVIAKRGEVIVRIEFHYEYTEQQKNNIIYQIENSRIYKLINEKLRAAKSDFEKALKLYEIIIQNTEYEKAAAIGDNPYYKYAYGIEGVMLNHRAVCAGYAKTFQYFANKHNLLCSIVTGETKRERHAWNLLQLYGDYYYVDATWGDPIFSNAADKSPDYISYDYFCITTDDLKISHQPRFDDPMPICTATKYNYYEFFGLKESSYSVENVASHIVSSLRTGKSDVVIKYTTETAYRNAAAGLFTRSEVFEALKLASRYEKQAGTREIQYKLNDAAKIVTIML